MMKQLYFLLLLGMMCVSTNWMTPLSAQTIYVNQDANGTKDGSSWTNAFTDLQAAIGAAPAGADIWIAKGVYQPGETAKSFQIDKQLHLFGGFSGSEARLADRNLNDNQTILSGDNLGDDLATDLTSNRSDNSYHVVYLEAGSSGGSLNNLSIINGHGDPEAQAEDPRRYGGGVYSLANAYEFKVCRFEANSTWQGGAIDIATGATGGIQFTDCIFQNNQAEFGGAISSFESGTILEIENGAFSNNHALNPNIGAGGAIYTGSSTNLQVSQSNFYDNSAAVTGGAVALFNDVTASFSEVSFTDNTAEESSGGGLYVSDRITLTLTKVDFLNNQCGRDGGGLYLDLSEPFQLNISESNFRNNFAADDGGGLFLDGLFIPDRLQIEDCLFSENTCNSSGGAILLMGAPCKIINCQFQKNKAGSGAGISTDLNSVILDLENCDFIENEATFAGAVELFRGGSSNIFNCRFLRNKAVGGSGGAISYDQNKPSTGPQPEHTLDASVFDGNEVGAVNGTGGFGSALFGFNANIDITNSLFINQKTVVHATIFNAAFNASIDKISLINCTFAQNDNNGTATLGADNVNSDQASYILQNTIFADAGDGFINLTGSAVVTSQGGNLCSNNSMNDILTHQQDQTVTAPGFKNEMNDFSLLSDSPAINAGVNTGAPEKDLIGNPRDGLVDIGAYESQEVSGLFDRPSLAGQVSVYPNPVGNELHFSLDNQQHGPINLRIMDATGKVLQQQLIHKGNNRLEATMSTTDLPSGIYLLQLFNRDGERTTKFVKE